MEATTHYLSDQIDAGAEVVQLFDSWAGVLSESEFRRWVIEPTKRISAVLKARHPAVPIIGFPRGGGALYGTYTAESGVDAVSLEAFPVEPAAGPALVVGGAAMTEAVGRIRAAFQAGPFVFNLGHGIVPETPLEHVAELVALIRSGAKSS